MPAYELIDPDKATRRPMRTAWTTERLSLAQRNAIRRLWRGFIAEVHGGTMTRDCAGHAITAIAIEMHADDVKSWPAVEIPKAVHVELNTSRPFSNGTEGDAWTNVWCAECKHDHGFHAGDHPNEGGCAYLMAALTHDTDDPCNPGVWLNVPMSPPSRPLTMVCTKFEPCNEDECTPSLAASKVRLRTQDALAAWKAEH